MRRLALVLVLAFATTAARADDALEVPTITGEAGHADPVVAKLARLTLEVPASGKPRAGALEKEKPWRGLLFSEHRFSSPAKVGGVTVGLRQLDGAPTLVHDEAPEGTIGPIEKPEGRAAFRKGLAETRDELRGRDAVPHVRLLVQEGVPFSALAATLVESLGVELVPDLVLVGTDDEELVETVTGLVTKAAGDAGLAPDALGAELGVRIVADRRADARIVCLVLRALRKVKVARFTFAVKSAKGDVDLGARDEWRPPGMPVGDAIGVGGGAGGLSPRYAGRFGGRRNLVARNGGSMATESAAEAALRWLARHQLDGGDLPAAPFAERCTPKGCCSVAAPDTTGVDDVSQTALAALALLGAGNTHLVRTSYVDKATTKTVRWGDVVRRALKHLTENHARGEPASRALAALALVEARGLTNAVNLRAPTELALAGAAKAWTDVKEADRDPWAGALLGLAFGLAATDEGIKLPAGARAAVLAWTERELARTEVDDPRLSAALVARRALLGKPDDASKRAFDALEKRLGTITGAGSPFAAHWITLAVFHHAGPSSAAWKKWNERVVVSLCRSQRLQKDGCLDGAWEPATEAVPVWARGRVAATALDALTLETYYRHPVGFGTKDGR